MINSRRHKVVLCLTASVVVLAAAGIASSRPAAPPPALSAAAADQLRAQVLNIAAANGEPSPKNGRYVQVSRRLASQLTSGGDIPDDGSAVLVVLEGHFTSSGPRPYGQAAATGSVMTITVDRSTLEPRDLTISNTLPDLTQLGTLTALGN